MTNKKTRKTAYSLLELSIVIVIISILISGAMTVAVGNISRAKITLTKNRMQEVYKALGNYVAANGKLPCPANITALKSSTTYGTAATTCSATSTGVYVSNNVAYGMVPTLTLGLSKDLAEDGFGSKIAYMVQTNFVNAASVYSPPDFSQTNNFSIAAALLGINNTTTGFVVSERIAGGALRAVENNTLLALISYGVNENGAFDANSNTQNTRSADNDEKDNDLAGNTFDLQLISKSESSDVFDDSILAIGVTEFIAEFNLQRLFPCRNSGSIDAAKYNNGGQYNNAWYGQTVYGDPCSSYDYNLNYAKKCAANGVWIKQFSCTGNL